jgi:2-polyprenyl-3-methyl-5-hydroxy-6-metoxy-1,4-benzoquinol methylase
VSYDPSCFNVTSEDEAKRIILTPEGGYSTTERWEAETQYLEPILKGAIPEYSRVLDFGCGIGRLSKVLISQGHAVTGVDISPSMRRMAEAYVNNPSFSTMSVRELMGTKVKFGGVVCAWILQHVLELELTIELLHENTVPGSTLFLLNRGRCVPMKNGWVDDGKVVETCLRKRFERTRIHIAPDHIFAPGAEMSEWKRRT